jgi:Holliday junction DNA helicase RuvA
MSLHRGAEVSVHTALIVREDDLSLFGFAELDELTVFNLLRSVTGVGPRSALGVLAVMRPADVSLAVVTDDDAAFRRVSGIGPKTAKLIVLTLAGKVSLAPLSGATVAPAATSLTHDVVVALVGLGWPERLAMTAVDEAIANANEADAASVSALLRLALAQLGPRSRVLDSQ